MATTQKAIELAQYLRESHKLRFGTRATPVTVPADISFDTDGHPYYAIGAGSPGGKNAIVKVRPVSWPTAKDVLNLSAQIFTPHVIQIVTELNPTGGSGADILAPQDLSDLLGDIF